MAPPTGDEIKVAVEALRTEAGIWETEGAKLGTVAVKTADLRLSRIEAGVFQILVGPYDSAAEQLTARCSEGKQQMLDVGTTLRQVATTYLDEDQRNEHRIRNLY